MDYRKSKAEAHEVLGRAPCIIFAKCGGLALGGTLIVSCHHKHILEIAFRRQFTPLPSTHALDNYL